jgi:hypothetical protein
MSMNKNCEGYPCQSCFVTLYKVGDNKENYNEENANSMRSL